MNKYGSKIVADQIESFCIDCGLKAVKEFSTYQKGGKLRYKSRCKTCQNTHERLFGNKKKKRANCENYRKAHLEKKNEIQKRYYYRHKNKCLEDSKEWKRNNPEKVIISRQVCYANRRSAESKCATKLKFKDWLVIKEKYNYTCLKCGRKEPEIKLTIDHVIPLSRGGNSSPENIQPLCGKCNCEKHTKVVDFRKEEESRA